MATLIDLSGVDRIELLFNRDRGRRGRRGVAMLAGLLCELHRRRQPLPKHCEVAQLCGIAWSPRAEGGVADKLGWLMGCGYIAEEWIEWVPSAARTRPATATVQQRYYRPSLDVLNAYLGASWIGRERRRA